MGRRRILERCHACDQPLPQSAAVKWRRKFLGCFPVDTHAWIGLTLNALLDAAETRNPLAGALWALKRAAVDLRDQGYPVPLDWTDCTPAMPEEVEPMLRADKA